MKARLLFLSLLPAFAVPNLHFGGTVSEDQQQYVKRYAKQKNVPEPAEMLINTDPEPSLDEGFVDLYNGENLDGWVSRGGFCTFEPKGEAIVGTTVQGSPNTFLCTTRSDYSNFIFSVELKWIVEGNSGIMFRARSKEVDGGERVFGPQCEMEGTTGQRRWSGGIFGEGAGGWFYPLWLEAHSEARNAIDAEGWNRVTIQAIGSNVKTWINGVPAANWENEEYLEGFFGLQVHSGRQGQIEFRNIKVKELPSEVAKNLSEWKDLFGAGDFSLWSRVNGDPVSVGWSLEDGVIHRSGFLPGGIVTKKEYKNFELLADWKISEGGNSGIKYRTRGRVGMEYQILDDLRHKDGKNPLHEAGSLYDLVGPGEGKSLNPAGEWNHSRILARENHVEHWLNGRKVVSIQIGSEDWNERLQDSKFRKNDGFGTWTGPILLQDHMDSVWFRNVLVREI
ncbi:MAG: DUF1080 domain-containing protein [Verrucomicrobiota bacterium]